MAQLLVQLVEVIVGEVVAGRARPGRLEWRKAGAVRLAVRRIGSHAVGSLVFVLWGLFPEERKRNLVLHFDPRTARGCVAVWLRCHIELFVQGF